MKRRTEVFSVGVEAKLKHGDFLTALQARGWNQSQAARFLNITASEFTRWINMHEVPDWRSFSTELTTRCYELTGKMPEELWPEEVFTEEFIKAPKKIRSVRNVPVNLLAIAGVIRLPAPTPQDAVEEEERRRIVNATLKTLPERERIILGYRFFEGKTLEETGQELGVTRERIRQIEAKALRHLRHPVRAHRLEQVL